MKKALRETELAITGRDELTVDYKIVGLRHDSPATIVLEAIPVNGQPSANLIPEVVTSFTDELRLIRREKKLLIEPDLPRLRAYQDIGKREHSESRIEKVKIRSGRLSVTIDRTFKRNLDEIVGPDEFAEGTIAGNAGGVEFSQYK